MSLFELKVCSYRCEHCGEYIELGEAVVILRVGCEKKSKKSKRWYFNPESFDDEIEEKWFHFNCLNDRLDFTDVRSTNGHCSFCPEELAHDVLYFELELGAVVDKEEGFYFDCEKRIYSCWDCVFDGLADGTPRIAREILGMNDGGEEMLNLFDTTAYRSYQS